MSCRPAPGVPSHGYHRALYRFLDRHGRLGKATWQRDVWTKHSALSPEASRQRIPSFSGLALQWNRFEQQLAVSSKTDLLNYLR